MVAEGQGGLMDVAVDPEYAENGWIYLAYSHALPKREGKGRPLTMTRLVRGHIRENAWVDQEVLYEAAPEFYGSTRHHYGCRIVFDPEGYLYFSVGERGIGRHAQDLSRPTGKVHRIHRDGSIPKGNPFVGVEAALPTIFTYGNRNPQGLAVHPQTGRVRESEHGPMGGDGPSPCSDGRTGGGPVRWRGQIVSEGSWSPREWPGNPRSGSLPRRKHKLFRSRVAFSSFDELVRGRAPRLSLRDHGVIP